MANNRNQNNQEEQHHIRYPSVSLQEYIEMKMGELDKRVELKIEERDKRYEEKFAAKDFATRQAQAAAKEAVEKAQASMERRLEAMNEFRASVNDILATTIPRSEYALLHDTMAKDIVRITESVESRVLDTLPRQEYNAQHKALVEALQTHITTEQEKSIAQETKQDEKLGVIASRIDGINKWLIGALGGVTIALILTVVDILVRQFS
jgi:DNA topoisomerase IB